MNHASMLSDGWLVREGRKSLEIPDYCIDFP